MLLRFVVYWALCLDALARRQLLLAVMCFGVPFAGPAGMWIAALAAVAFAIQGCYVEGALSMGLVVFNLVGNHLARTTGTRWRS
ncbi:MAG: hypothetical protein ABSF25_01905 [Bryobacteraceae bacterium]|jgi:hypothetical protein